jgi:Zn-dependent peptidase ImmA (M78 family)
MLERGFKTWCENVSLQIRTELGLTGTAPLNPEALAKHLNVLLWKPIDIRGLSAEARLVLLRKERDSWSAVTVSFAGVDVVIYNSSHSKARQSSDIMHELSHILIGHEPGKIFLSQNGQIMLRTYDQTQEEEAACLANALLLPREVLLFIKRAGMSDSKACEVYGVSRKLLTFRINISGVNRQVRQTMATALK